MRLIAVGALSMALALGMTASASASTLLSTTLGAQDASARNCIGGVLSGSGVAKRTVTAPSAGWVTARLRAASGDWDLALFDASSNRMVAGSAQFGATELAQGVVLSGQRLVLQACRRSGFARTASVSVDFKALDRSVKPEKLSLVKVSTPTAERKAELDKAGLDLTEHGGRGFVEVVLHGADDAALLRRHNFTYTTRIADLAASDRRDRRAELTRSRSSSLARAAALPSGRTATYRRLPDYQNEMKQLVARNPKLVKPITLPFKTWTGMSVQGIEITENVKARDGKPVFLNMGVHHAREWPSGEMAMEWAHELVNGFRRNDARVKRLLGATRTIIIPVVNPEGFNTSREAGETGGVGGGRPGNDTVETANLLVPYEYQRKNCRVNNTNGTDPNAGDCTQQPALGLAQFGVDPNRNYGGFWGGPGAAANGEAPPGGDFAQDYRGNGPFSEPETRNIRDLVSKRHVVTLITNHTFSNLLLRPPGIQVQGPPPDEPVYKSLGDSMAAENGYTSQKSYELYDTTGGTEDWTYYATGGLGYTFEIGLIGFHPPYAETASEYDGTSEESGAGRGNREAYFKALESTSAVSRHSRITGKAPPGAVLRLKKTFKTSTSPVIDANGVEGKPILFDDTLNTLMDVPSSGNYSWDINPSTRPVVAKARGRAAHGRPSNPTSVTEAAPAAPCGAADATNPACYKDYGFTVPAGAGIDNAKATVDVEWGTAASDYDITIFRDSNGDGSSLNETQSVGTSAAGTTNRESASFGEPAEVIAGKKYVVRVVNFAGAEPYTVRYSYGGPAPFQPARTEAWNLTCESAKGRVGERKSVTIARGARRTIDLAACLQVVRSCVSTKGGVRGTRIGAARLARTRTKQRATLFGTRFSDRKGIDRYCVAKGGTLRAGYPTGRLGSKLTRKTRKRIRKKAILLLSTSKAFKIRKIRRGTSTRTLRTRLRGERRVRIGKNTWYYAKGKSTRLLFRTRKGKVLEVGLGSSSLTKSRRSVVRFLRAWDKRGKTL